MFEVMHFLRGLLVVFSLFAVGPLYGAQLECSQENALSVEEAEKIISQVETAYKALEAFAAEFLQESFLAALELTEVSSGKVRYQKKGFMRWDYEFPEEQVFLLKKNEFWFFQPAENQVTLDAVDRVLLSEIPVSFLFGVGSLSDEFEEKLVCQSQNGWVLSLQPAGQGRELAELRLQVNKEFFPEEAHVVDAGGNETRLSFSKVTKQDSFPADVFALDIPQGVDVIDRRKGL